MTWLISAAILALTIMVGMTLAPTEAKAWGEKGHLTVCDLAYRNLTPATRAALTDLLQSRSGGIHVPGRGQIADRHYTSFNIGCLEEDAMPRRHLQDHFINVGRNVLTIDSAACPRDGNCILSGIDRDLGILRDSSRSREDRVFALMALGHWLGDIHQPLHVSFADDRGGNRIGVPSFRCGGSRYRSDNLHSIWDACILEAGLFDRVRRRADFRSTWGERTITYRAVDTLMANTSLAEEETIVRGDPRAWADESFQIALAPATLYCVRIGANCQYSDTAPTLVGNAPKRRQVIDAAYLAAHDRVAENRVRYAGFRLAHLMNQALDPGYTGPTANGDQPA
ncbi:S1/P1 nuclease [Brevundimonas vesicularis]|uniref:S1/P1 nuclease n=1 Tax=Brevundimonas vesicularis TaxID=41276 RepID=UPI00384E6FFF